MKTYALIMTLVCFALGFQLQVQAETFADMAYDYGYKPDIIGLTTTITWVSDPTVVEEELANHQEEYGVNANAITWYGEDWCTVVAHEPKQETLGTDLRTLGHEFAHCLRGKWHE